MEEVKMEWDEWFAKYQPVMVDAVMDDGIPLELYTVSEVMDWIENHKQDGLIWSAYFPSDEIPILNEEDIARHVWTTTSGDGWSYTSTGFHFVDRESYMICKIPWKTENEACMYHDSGTWCDHCDEYVKECEHEDKLI